MEVNKAFSYSLHIENFIGSRNHFIEAGWRIQAFVWRVLKGKTLTRMALSKRGLLNLGEDLQCTLCGPAGGGCRSSIYTLSCDG